MGQPVCPSFLKEVKIYLSLIAILLALLMMLLQGMIPVAQPNKEAKVPEDVIVSAHTEVPADCYVDQRAY